MTKNLLSILFLIFCAQLSYANKVDDLKTDADVQKFIATIDTSYISAEYAKDIKVNSTKHIINNNKWAPNIRKWGIRNWVKADFNNDGRTDLLVIAYLEQYYNFIAIDKGDNTYQLININYSPGADFELINTIRKGSMQLVLFHRVKLPIFIDEKNHKKKQSIETDTLIYKFGGFIDLNRKPAHYLIDSIGFSSGPCLGTCPTIFIKTDRSGNAIYLAGTYSKKEGTFKGIINKSDIDNIIDLINYISIKKLRNKYSVNWTDSPTCSIRIKFSDGSIKYITDYGEQGTFGLSQLYTLIFDLRDSQKWTAEN